jgi:hypothetical protein
MLTAEPESAAFHIDGIPYFTFSRPVDHLERPDEAITCN